MSHDPYAALKARAFRWALSCHFTMIIAAQMQATAFGWLIYDRTGSAAALGLTGLMMFLPVLLLALPVGHWVDSRDRKSVLLLGQAIIATAAGMMCALTFFAAPVGYFFLAMALSGTGNAFASIARPTIMREVTPSHHAENGANWSHLSRRIASVLGPIVAGVTIARYGPLSAFAMTGISHMVAMIATTHIPMPPSRSSDKAMTFHSLTEGLRYMGKNPLILSTTLLDLFAVLLGGATGLLPLFAKDILHVGATGLGVLAATPNIGSGLTALLLAHRPPIRHAGRSLLLTVAAYGAMTILFGLSTSPILSFIALLLVGGFDSVSVTIRATILQIFVPSQLRGRVYGVNTVFVYSSNELGDFESGLAASLVGPVAAVIGGGVGAVLMAVYFGWHWPQLRALRRLQ